MSEMAKKAEEAKGAEEAFKIKAHS